MKFTKKINIFKYLWNKNKNDIIKFIEPEIIIQFGSSIKKKEYNDIDLLIISKKFKYMNEFEVKKSIEPFFPKIKLDLWYFYNFDYVNSNLILKEIINTGKVLFNNE